LEEQKRKEEKAKRDAEAAKLAAIELEKKKKEAE